MSLAKKCDICGEFYKAYNTTKNEENTSGFAYLNMDPLGKGYFTNTAYDCCPTCMALIRNAIRSVAERTIEGEV